MPANNVNCEALRLVLEAAREHVEVVERRNEQRDLDENEDHQLLLSAIWMLEQHVKQFDEANECTN